MNAPAHFPGKGTSATSPRSGRSPRPCARPRADRGFSMTELLVVISIVVVLAGILLVAMQRVKTRAGYTRTEGTIRAFSGACDAFKIDHQTFPGVIPDTVLGGGGFQGQGSGLISGTENALLHLNGGYRDLTPSPSAAAQQDYDDYTGYSPTDTVLEIAFGTSGWRLKVVPRKVGEGPLIDGRPLSPYFSGEPALASYDPSTNQIPELLDAWGQPIVYVRRSRSSGPLVGDGSGQTPPQFLTGSMMPYVASSALGKLAKDQRNNSNAGSILNWASDPAATFAQIIRAPAFGEPDQPQDGQARGGYVIFSAGPDGIYFSRQDGPGTPETPVDNIVTGQYGNPKVVAEYDDLVRFGGGE